MKQKDLSGIHEQLTDLFPQPQSVEEWQPYKLSEEQKAQFKPIPIELKKGYATFHHPLTVHGSATFHLKPLGGWYTALSF